MNQTVTLLLFLSGEAPAAERRALATFQARERVTLAAPVAGLPTPRQIDADQVARRAEAALEEAQTLASSLDEARALELLAELERELLAHPELPQAAWLMAERHHVAAEIRKNQPDGAEDAARLVASARALEGPRAERFGETAGATAAPEGPSSPSSTLLAVRDLAPYDVLVLDGRAVAASERVAPGRHHARVLRDSALAWSGWFDVPSGARAETVLGVPERVPCESGDLARVTPGARAPRVPPGVRCGRFIAVRRAASGLEVSWCEGPRCSAYGPLLHEQIAVEPASSIAPWAAAAIVGAATIGAASILIATGSFERERPPPTTSWTYTGPK